MAADQDPGLTSEDHKDVDDNLGLRAPVVYEIVRRTGEEELRRPSLSLWWSGVAAGVALSTSVYCEGFLHNVLPDAPWRPAVENFGYCLGFLIVILGRFQLFTENTITVILPLLAQRTWSNLGKVARLWTIVFIANMAGSLVSAGLAVFGQVAEAEQLAGALEISRHFAEKGPWETLRHGIPAGFFIAALVWILPNAKGSEFWVIVAVTYAIALGDFAHVVAGSTEVFLLMLIGELGVVQTLFAYILPALIGNVIGGTVLFSLIAYGQVSAEID